MSVRTGCTINGVNFRETWSSGAVRTTRRFFVDGKLVTKAAYLVAVKEAKAAMRELNRRDAERHPA